VIGEADQKEEDAKKRDEEVTPERERRQKV